MKWHLSGRGLNELHPGQGAHLVRGADYQGRVWHWGGVPGWQCELLPVQALGGAEDWAQAQAGARHQDTRCPGPRAPALRCLQVHVLLCVLTSVLLLYLQINLLLYLQVYLLLYLQVYLLLYLQVYFLLYFTYKCAYKCTSVLTFCTYVCTSFCSYFCVCTYYVSFRSGLGNSLYCPSHKVGSHGTADLAAFTSKHFTSGRWDEDRGPNKK